MAEAPAEVVQQLEWKGDRLVNQCMLSADNPARRINRPAVLLEPGMAWPPIAPAVGQGSPGVPVTMLPEDLPPGTQYRISQACTTPTVSIQPPGAL